MVGRRNIVKRQGLAMGSEERIGIGAVLVDRPGRQSVRLLTGACKNSFDCCSSLTARERTPVLFTVERRVTALSLGRGGDRRDPPSAGSRLDLSCGSTRGSRWCLSRLSGENFDRDDSRLGKAA